MARTKSAQQCCATVEPTTYCSSECKKYFKAYKSCPRASRNNGTNGEGEKSSISDDQSGIPVHEAILLWFKEVFNHALYNLFQLLSDSHFVKTAQKTYTTQLISQSIIKSTIPARQCSTAICFGTKE